MSSEKKHPAERVSFGIALVVVLAVVGAVLAQVPGSKEPAAPRVVVGRSQERDGRFFVPVAVKNEGDQTAENVQVNATLTIDGEEHTADQVVMFLAGGETEDLQFVFEDDPAEGELVVEVAGFALP
ncbi:MAG TPA: hypothetical protein VM143_17560 [Acidimicrobiales bacterium]|nr:hypothetical protein [Acidimicrobiales bacterium]